MVKFEDVKPYAKELLASGAATVTAFVFGGAIVGLLIVCVVAIVGGLFMTGWLKQSQIDRIERKAKNEARQRRHEYRKALRQQ